VSAFIHYMLVTFVYGSKHVQNKRHNLCFGLGLRDEL